MNQLSCSRLSNIVGWGVNKSIAVNFPIEAIGRKKPERYQGFNGIRTRDLCDTGAMLDQLSCEATNWERGQFVEYSEMM